MKKIILFVVLLLATAISVNANSISSSTMYFQGTLTDSGGMLSGTILAIPGTYYMAGGSGCIAGLTPDGSVCVGF
jgi:hypothetical protein